MSIYEKFLFYGTCYAFIGTAYAVMKYTINMPRPFCSVDDIYTVIDVSLERCNSSFPSAHTAIALLTSSILWPYASRMIKGLIIMLVIAVMLSRIALAMHFPADIAFSVIIFIILYFAIKYFLQIIRNIIVKPIGYSIYKIICTN